MDHRTYNGANKSVSSFYTPFKTAKIYKKEDLAPQQIRNFVRLDEAGLGVPVRQVGPNSLNMKGTIVLSRFLLWIAQYHRSGFLPSLKGYESFHEIIGISTIIKKIAKQDLLSEIERLRLGLKKLRVAHCDIKLQNLGLNYQTNTKKRTIASFFKQDSEDFKNGRTGQLYPLDNDAVASYGRIRTQYTERVNRPMEYDRYYKEVVCETTDDMGFNHVIQKIEEAFSTPSRTNLCPKLNRPIRKSRTLIPLGHKRTDARFIGQRNI